MPIRIYALAKELKIDSKELVDICTRAGIQGKGSALASLDDAELDKVKSFLAGGDEKPSATATATAEPEKPQPKAKGPLAAAAAAAAAPTKPTPAAPEQPPEQYTRDDYIAPAAPTKVKVLGKSKPDAGKSAKKPDDAEPKPKKKREPVINLAKLPEVKQPTPGQTASNEPPAQKPEIRLPKDAMTQRKGGRAPLEHLTKQAEKAGKSPLAGKGSLGRGGATPDAAPATGAGGRGRRTKGGAPAADGEKPDRLAGMASARQDRQKQRRARAKVRVDDDDNSSGGGRSYNRRRTLTRRGTNTAAPRKGKVALELPCTVRTFSEATGVSVRDIQKTLMGMGVMATINAQIEDDLVEVLAGELGVELEYKQQESLEDAVLTAIREQDDAPDSLIARPPVVTFLGHVDHGKTSLLDRLLGIDVVSGEAGGITQHIRAYKIGDGEKQVAFVDTPGHEAFTEMRARGANVTDIAVLVVAADDGVMPQTEEAISHAKAAEVPIVVALNKMDLPGADENRALQQLAGKDLLASEWGGDVEVVKTSAINGDGIEELLETLLTIAELHEYQANPDRSAMGICLESHQEQGRGVVAKVIVQNGTMKVGDIVVCGPAHGRVKAMYNTLSPNETVEEATPSTPVNITGLDIAPGAGDAFYVLDDVSKAREIASQRAERTHEAGLAGGGTPKISFEQFQQLLEEGRLHQAEEVTTLNLIIRADVQGSLEAIHKEFEKLEHPEVQVKVLQESVGGITVGDVQLANASNAVIAGFNVIPDEAARSLADEYQIEIRRYDIIYKLTEDIKAMLEGKLKPEERVVELGRAVVKQVFRISRVGEVAGCYVVQGKIQRGCRIRVNRDGRTIGDYPLDSVRHVKEDVREVPRGMECGLRLGGFNDVKQDDVLEAYVVEEVARTL